MDSDKNSAGLRQVPMIGKKYDLVAGGILNDNSPSNQFGTSINQDINLAVNQDDSDMMQQSNDFPSGNKLKSSNYSTKNNKYNYSNNKNDQSNQRHIKIKVLQNLPLQSMLMCKNQENNHLHQPNNKRKQSLDHKYRFKLTSEKQLLNSFTSTAGHQPQQQQQHTHQPHKRQLKTSQNEITKQTGAIKLQFDANSTSNTIMEEDAIMKRLIEYKRQLQKKILSCVGNKLKIRRKSCQCSQCGLQNQFQCRIDGLHYTQIENINDRQNLIKLDNMAKTKRQSQSQQLGQSPKKLINSQSPSQQGQQQETNPSSFSHSFHKQQEDNERANQMQNNGGNGGVQQQIKSNKLNPNYIKQTAQSPSSPGNNCNEIGFQQQSVNSHDTTLSDQYQKQEIQNQNEEDVPTYKQNSLASRQDRKSKTIKVSIGKIKQPTYNMDHINENQKKKYNNQNSYQISEKDSSNDNASDHESENFQMFIQKQISLAQKRKSKAKQVKIDQPYQVINLINTKYGHRKVINQYIKSKSISQNDLTKSPGGQFKEQAAQQKYYSQRTEYHNQSVQSSSASQQQLLQHLTHVQQQQQQRQPFGQNSQEFGGKIHQKKFYSLSDLLTVNYNDRLGTPNYIGVYVSSFRKERYQKTKQNSIAIQASPIQLQTFSTIERNIHTKKHQYQQSLKFPHIQQSLFKKEFAI